ncbi:MAG: ABC transporter permease [Rubrobacteraceae bacterium]|nr:ABC transporter permease [Rubrobacteraceae bacterium]
MLVLIVLAIVVNSIIVPEFFSYYNLIGSTTYAVEIGLLSLGQMLVIISGGGAIDLSVGSMVSFASIIFGLAVTDGHLNVWLAAVVTVLFGLLMGSVNGFLVAKMGFSALIVTLATLYAYSAIPLVLTNTKPISNLPQSLLFLTSSVKGIPMQTLIVYIPVILILAFLLMRTVIGRHLYGVGTNATAAKFALTPVQWTRFWAFAASGLLAGMAAVVTTSRFASARPDAGVGLELQSITVAVLGGVAITGGVGGVVGVVLATLLIALVDNGLILANVQSTYQVGALGFILIGSALLNEFAGRRSRRRA